MANGIKLSLDHVVRGGAWSTDAVWARSTVRGWQLPNEWAGSVGFRCVVTGDPGVPLGPKIEAD